VTEIAWLFNPKSGAAMAAPQLDSGRVDRSAFTVTTFEAAEREDWEYWLRSDCPRTFAIF
jgi:hypothetical protein